MEIVTSPRPPAPSGWSRLVVAVAVFAPVTLLALLPIGFGLERYVVTGDDMSPEIGRGSVVLEREVPVSDLRAGDVITFEPPADSGIGGQVTRRIVSISNGWAKTRADSDSALDPWTLRLDHPTEKRVVAVLPFVGYVYLALVATGPIAGVVAAGVGLLGLLVAAALGRRREPARA
jgi:signal peptidase